MVETEGLQEELGRFLSQPRLANVADAEGHRWLSIPGHAPHIVPAYQNRTRGWRLSARSNEEFYEEPATMVFSTLLSRLEPATVFDIGAWQGHFSFVAASHTAAHPSVFAFDMRPAGIETIQRRADELEWTARVHAHLCGLSDTHIGPTRVWSARMKLFESKPREDEYREAIWRRLTITRGHAVSSFLSLAATRCSRDRKRTWSFSTRRISEASRLHDLCPSASRMRAQLRAPLRNEVRLYFSFGE